ncbi:MAG TPA: tetratricopeptide repeat protein [Ktedonobacterales bacterium]|nr:tetratricopeptide repeat protein [Ktedonobacterales bacterium]
MNRMSYRGGQGGQTIIPGGPLGKARYALALGRADEAERICRKRLEQRPDDVAARILLSQALLQSRQAQDAVTEARKATRSAPNNPDAQLALSAALLQTARFSIPEEARVAAERAVQLAPKLSRARVQLAEVYIADKKEEQAKVTAEEAIKLEPRNPAGYFIKALALSTQKDYQGAAQAAESAIRFDRDHQLPQAEYIRATALVEIKRYDEALTALAAAERGNPLLGGAQADALRGRVYFRQRKFRDSYQANLSAQRKSRRPEIFARPLAALNMVFTGLFGDRGQYVLLFAVMAIVVGILYLISLIPVAGQWISSGLVVVILVALALASVGQLSGSILPADRSQWVTTIPAIVAAFIIGAGVTIALARLIIGAVTGATPPLFTPTTISIAGAVGAVLAAVAAWGWPKLLARYGGGRTAA